jgi:1-acyl-sn-glycerol-3-phosphate acyltransferase
MAAVRGSKGVTGARRRRTTGGVAAVRRGFWLRFAEGLIRPTLWIMTKPSWFGQENIPARGPAILVVNHISYVDPLVVAHYVYDRPRELRFLAKASLFDVFFVGFVLKQVKQIPVFRASRDAKKALQAAIEALERGEALVIYPEGTCTKDPDLWPMRGKTGVARLWFATRAPVVPVAQWGAQRIHNPVTGKVRLRPRTPVAIGAGVPIDLSAFDGAEPTGETLKQVTDLIMRRLRDDVAEVRGEPVPTGPLYDPSADPSASAEEVAP